MPLTKEERYARHRVWYAENKEKVQATQKKWQEANKERVVAYNHQRWVKRKPEMQARNKAWWAENKEAEAVRSRAWRLANSERAAMHGIKKEYGLTTEQATQLQEMKQTAVCQICGNDERIHIDHCHSSGRVRGFLCSGCNLSLGHAKENPATLRALADYLESNASLLIPPASTTGRPSSFPPAPSEPA